jgi:hypothetical protein
MTPEEKTAYELEQKNLLEKIEKQVKDILTENPELKKAADLAVEVKSLKDSVAAMKPGEDMAPIKEEVVRLAAELKALKEKGTPTGALTMKGQVNKFIADNHEKIKQLKAAGAGHIELELKVVGPMETTSATNPDGIPEIVGVQMAPPARVNLRTTIVNGLVSQFSTGLAAYPYTESLPKDGDYAFVLEKGTKPQIDFKIETRYAQPVKVAAHIILTDESIQDIPGLQSIANSYLKDKHDLKRQNGILFGDGISPNPKGATKYGRLFSAGAMANSVSNPNFMDVVNAAITDIFTTHNFTDEMPYMSSLVLVNPIDFFVELVAAKDGFGHPLYPMASLFNRVTIGGATIVPFEDIPAGKIFVADMSKYNTTNYIGYTVKIGWINDQLITNQFTMVGESRFHAFVKKLDEQAFIYDDISTIRAAISSTS